MTSQWRHIDFWSLFALFDRFYYLCQNFSEFRAFLGKFIFDDFLAKMFCKLEKWRHAKNLFLLFKEFLFYNFLENFIPTGAFLPKVRGGSKFTPPPPCHIGVSHIPCQIGLISNKGNISSLNSIKRHMLSILA